VAYSLGIALHGLQNPEILRRDETIGSAGLGNYQPTPASLEAKELPIKGNE